MANASYVQTNFLGGAWAPGAQDRTDMQQYKTALKSCTNSYPKINGSWTRRQGFLWMGHTRRGGVARLLGFDFTFSDPYQLELSSNYMRVYQGDKRVFTNDPQVVVSAISTANPAVVTVVGTLPSGWAAEDTVVFQFQAEMSTPSLSGRTFKLGTVTTSTFELYDELTGASVDGSALAYVAPPADFDTVAKILEYSTPYTADQINGVRLISNNSVALLLSQYRPPQALTYDSCTGALSLAEQAFTDGPYLDINTTATTITPSGATGSITLTASAVTGINNDHGFMQTDVGRFVRFRSAPAAWASGTTYVKDDTVTGSDGNIYLSVAGSNTGNDPTTDNATHWVLTGATIEWTWLKITAWTSTTVVTATVEGADLIDTTASIYWQLGLYSYTTGFPTCGTYHEGRFWLGGSVVPNRVDASNSNDVFNFAPSASDGTVGDANAIAEIANAPQNNIMYWMTTGQEGVLMGASAGEWLIRASSFGDPLTPTTIQIKRVSTYGCADIEPVLAKLTTVFVQRKKRKLMDFDHYPYGETAGWYAEDLTLLSHDKTIGGVEEIRYQQEPNTFVWGRRADGVLVGTTFEHAPYGRSSYNGWHDHALGGSRTVNSISTGPAADGLSTALYATLKNATTGYYENVVLSAAFDDAASDWAANFADAVGQTTSVKVLYTASGDSIDGVRLYGFTDVAGESVDVVIAGLDLGTFTVASGGYVDIAFTTTFTLAFVQALSGTDYGPLGAPVVEASTAQSASDGVGAYVGPLTNLTDINLYLPFLDVAQNWFIATQNDGIRLYDATTFDQIADMTSLQIQDTSGTIAGLTGMTCYHPDTQSLYFHVGATNRSPIYRVQLPDMKVTGKFGISGSSLLGSDITGFQTAINSFIPVTSLDGHHYVVQVDVTTANHHNDVSAMDADTMAYAGGTSVAETDAYLCPGQYGTGTFYMMGVGTDTFTLYSTTINCKNVAKTSIVTKVPADIEAAWSHFTILRGPMCDPTDGNIIVFAYTSDSGVTNAAYWMKINASTGAIMWQTGTTTLPSGASNFELNHARAPGGKLLFYDRSKWNSLDLSTGTLTQTSFGATVTVTGNQVAWPERDAIIGSYSIAWGTAPALYGTYANAHTSWTEWTMITPLGPFPVPAPYNIPVIVGNTYTSKGQLLRPDFGRDSGSQNGPAFGKSRRTHKYAISVERGQNFDIGVSFTDMYTVSVTDQDENAVAQPNLLTGTIRDNLQADYNYDNPIAWQVTRPTALTVTAVGGFLETMDV